MLALVVAVWAWDEWHQRFVPGRPACAPALAPGPAGASRDRPVRGAYDDSTLRGGSPAARAVRQAADRTYSGEVPSLRGMLAPGRRLEACREKLAEVVGYSFRPDTLAMASKSRLLW